MSGKRLWCGVFFLWTVIGLNAQERTPLAITIDDLPGLGTEDVWSVNNRIVTALTKNRWTAVGFVNEGGFYREGSLDSSRLEILNLWLKNGLELGNHTFAHLNYHETANTEYFDNILKGEKLTRSLSQQYGMPFRYFRHPYLRNGQTEDKKTALDTFLVRNDYEVAPVTIDNSEWIFSQAYRMAKEKGDRVMTDSIGRSYINYMVAISNYYRQQALRLTGRDIPHVLLIHVRELNADLLEELVKALEKERFVVAPLDKVLADPVYQLKDGYFGNAGISWVERWAMAQAQPRDFYSEVPRCPRFVLDYSGLKE